ncbi:sugar kinase [Neptunomonas sp. CHC150]|uniref:sugar kinase n=1 Tax=Neptunomonas sp. CHC150 TaxID=2998324 RepID=UPI0025B1DC18|nr:sugar kinase [Neptunomonas sp. CHC150]MDN2658595.1 sugar kinase [Neptunomonas sp. CHC150]
MTTLTIACIGECMVELQTKEGDIKQSYGGDTLNTAVYLSRLTAQHDIQVHYVTALGMDPFSHSMIESWRQEGINTDLVMRLIDKCPGIYYIEIDHTGERSFYYWRNDSAARYLFCQKETPSLLQQLMHFDALYLSGISLAILSEQDRETLLTFLSSYKAHGGKVFFDNNFRKQLWPSKEEAIYWYNRALQVTDTALLTFDDEIEIYGEHAIDACIERSLNANVREVIIKRGADNCFVVVEGNVSEVPALKVDNIVDTNAAGDSFNAGFLKTRLLQGTAADAAASGHKLASTVIQHKGAVIPKAFMPKL